MSRGEDPKEIKKKKDKIFSGIQYKYQLNYFQVKWSNQEDEDVDDSPAAKSTQYALISTSFKNEQMVAKMKAFDLLEVVMFPVLVEPDGYTPDDWRDFNMRYNVLLEHRKVSQEQVELWGKDCMRWGAHPSPIPNINYERQDQ